VIFDSLLIDGIGDWRLEAGTTPSSRAITNQQSAITNESRIKDHQIFN
jgi:hypothetical protein